MTIMIGVKIQRNSLQLIAKEKFILV